MKVATLSILLGVAGWACGASRAELQLSNNTESQTVFSGDARSIATLWHNAGTQAVDLPIRTRLFQTTSSTAVPINERPWKRIQAQPEQTITESANFNFPDVRAETPFLIQWLEGANRVLGVTTVLVYPTNLLNELNALAGENGLGLLDPNDTIKPLLKSLNVPFVDVASTGMGDFHGRLLLLGPFGSGARMPEDFAERVQKAAHKGVGVVWMTAPLEKRDKLQPSFYTVSDGPGCIVVAQPDMIANLAESPRSQLNLLHFARLAVRRETLRLPQTNQP